MRSTQSHAKPSVFKFLEWFIYDEHMANVIYDFTCSGKTECLEKGGGSRKGRGNVFGTCKVIHMIWGTCEMIHNICHNSILNESFNSHFIYSWGRLRATPDNWCPEIWTCSSAESDPQPHPLAQDESPDKWCPEIWICFLRNPTPNLRETLIQIHGARKSGLAFCRIRPPTESQSSGRWPPSTAGATGSTRVRHQVSLVLLLLLLLVLLLLLAFSCPCSP